MSVTLRVTRTRDGRSGAPARGTARTQEVETPV